LQIRDPDHLAIHPQRGGLFECLIVSELLKRRYNTALPMNLFFWRDNHGTEIDLIIDRGLELEPVEIKSGETVPGDFMKGLGKWLSWSGGKSTRGWLVYGGNQAYTQGAMHVVPWHQAATALPL